MSTKFTDRSTPFLYKKVKFTRRIGLKCPKSYKITKKVVTLTHHTFNPIMTGALCARRIFEAIFLQVFVKNYGLIFSDF